jgi:hypothetical protein
LPRSGSKSACRCGSRCRACGRRRCWRNCSGCILAAIPTGCCVRCRLAHGRASEGPERELIFRQEHPPGRQALSDFTDGGGLAVSIAGAPFGHLLSHFWLAYSGWQYVKAICGGERFTALTEGLQEALWQRGGVPREHRTDRLSAADRNLAAEDEDAKGYKTFCQPYRMEPTRNNAGVAHENGSVEASHGPLKKTLEEALTLRGSRDFADLAGYQAFLAETIARKNAQRRPAVAVELAAMGPLPRHRTTDFSVYPVSVPRSGTISVRGVLYTVPSRRVGCRLKVHVGACPRAGRRPEPGDDRLICSLGTTPVMTAERRYYRRNGPRQRVVDCRHLIGWLVRKPQAFRHSVFREALFARPVFRRAWEALDRQFDARKAGRVSVGLLHLAALPACEAQLADHLEAGLAEGGLPDLETARAAVAPVPAQMPAVTVRAPDPAAYDGLLREPVIAGAARP